MSVEIYYFSGTGNSLHIAKELQRRIPDTKLVPILNTGQDQISTNAKTVGFIFPQYASALPKVYMKFLKRLSLDSNQYLFAVATRGGTGCMAFVEVDKILSKQGRRLDSFFVITMPSGSAALMKDWSSQINEEKIAALESDAQSKLDYISQIITEKQQHRDEDLSMSTPPPAFIKPFIPVINKLIPVLLPLGKIVETKFEFYTDDKCDGCSLCKKICLADRIEMSNNAPVWSKEKNCYACFACFNYCPREAIQIKSKPYLKSFTEQNGKYHQSQRMK